MLFTRNIVSKVARRNKHVAFKPTSTVALNKRFFSDEVVNEAAVARAAELKAIRNTERLAQERHKRDKTVTPWFARTISPVAAEDATVFDDVTKG